MTNHWQTAQEDVHVHLKLEFGVDPPPLFRRSHHLNSPLLNGFPQLASKWPRLILYLKTEFLFVTSGAHWWWLPLQTGEPAREADVRYFIHRIHWRWLAKCAVAHLFLPPLIAFYLSIFYPPHWLHSAFYPSPPTKATYIIYVSQYSGILLAPTGALIVMMCY